MSGSAGATRYFDTVRHLRLRQIATRIRRRFAVPGPATGPHPPVREPRRTLVPPPARADEWQAPDRVRILNIERSFERGIDWSPEDAPRLWIYHLHYLSDLPGAAGRAERAWIREVVASWLDSNPVGAKNAWDPYPTSLRVVNLMKWLLLSGADRASVTAASSRLDGPTKLSERVIQSLAVQTRHLTKRIEYDVAANHLVANAVALTASGLFFGSAEGEAWLDRGLRLLGQELDEQVLADGGHFERSPMYQAIVLEQLLDVLNIWGVFPEARAVAEGLRARVQAKAASMLSWLRAMTHPDGEIAFFNDATAGAAATCADLAGYAARLGLDVGAEGQPGSQALRESGYFRLVSDDGRTVVIFDAGRIGPDYQPGHGHCDALSLEVSRDGERVLVNSGVSTYEPGGKRLLERRTESHNTVRVDGEEQCDVWSAFRCGRRLGMLAASSTDREAEGQHSGFFHLPGAPLHHRRVSVSERAVTVTDGFDGSGEHLMEWFVHLHPDVRLREVAGGFELSRRGAPLAVLRVPAELQPSIENSEWHPGFNTSVPNRRVVAAWKGRTPCDFVLEIRWL